jgi:hypothetical protein
MNDIDEKIIKCESCQHFIFVEEYPVHVWYCFKPWNFEEKEEQEDRELPRTSSRADEITPEDAMEMKVFSPRESRSSDWDPFEEPIVPMGYTGARDPETFEGPTGPSGPETTDDTSPPGYTGARETQRVVDGPEPREVSDSVIPANDEVFDIVSDLVMEIQRNSLPQSWFGYIKSFFW